MPLNLRQDVDSASATLAGQRFGAAVLKHSDNDLASSLERVELIDIGALHPLAIATNAAAPLEVIEVTLTVDEFRRRKFGAC